MVYFTIKCRKQKYQNHNSLMAQGIVDSSFQFHLASAKQNRITRMEIAEILTHAAFYAGWSKAWAAFRMAKEVWAEENEGM